MGYCGWLIDLDRGDGRIFVALAARREGNGGWAEAQKFNFFWLCDEVQILPRTQSFQQLQPPPSLRMAVSLIELDPNGLAKPDLID